MSGHSKWANIRVRKTAQDARRGKVYMRHARLVEIATREGGGPHSAPQSGATRGKGDPGTNTKLRQAIENAKADNVPKDIIERAIKKGSGVLKEGTQTTEVLYEAFGPGGTAFIIEGFTDNKNRSLSTLKTTLNRADARLAETGSVSWMFERKGIVSATCSEQPSAAAKRETLELQLIEAGAEDIAWGDGTVTVTTKPEGWARVRDTLKQTACEIQEAGLKYVPSQTIEVSDPVLAQRILDLVSAIEEDPDISEVHTNATIGVP